MSDTHDHSDQSSDDIERPRRVGNVHGVANQSGFGALVNYDDTYWDHIDDTIDDSDDTADIELRFGGGEPPDRFRSIYDTDTE